MRVGGESPPLTPQNFVGVMAADYGLEHTLIQLTNERQVNMDINIDPLTAIALVFAWGVVRIALAYLRIGK